MQVDFSQNHVIIGIVILVLIIYFYGDKIRNYICNKEGIAYFGRYGTYQALANNYRLTSLKTGESVTIPSHEGEALFKKYKQKGTPLTYGERPNGSLPGPENSYSNIGGR